MSFFNWSSSTFRPEEFLDLDSNSSFEKEGKSAITSGESIGNLINRLSYFSMFSSIKKIGFEKMKCILEKKNEKNNDFYKENQKFASTSFSQNLFSSTLHLGKNVNEVQNKIENQKIIIINTLPYVEQGCLIPYTLPFNEEESIINNIIENGLDNKVSIIIYGRNCNDDTVQKKYKQLTTFGFQKIFIYTGGLFEWVLLQDIYGVDEFPTTTVVLDILRFSPNKNN